MASQKYSPQEVRVQLEQLIQRTESLEPQLAQKLVSLKKWIEDKKNGFLITKTTVLELLTEIIIDTEFWLGCKFMTVEQKEQFYKDLGALPAEVFWYEEIFPIWFNGYDSKMPKWKQELMKGNSVRSDEIVISNALAEIESLGGSGVWRFLLDLSMATDLLVAGTEGFPLLTQLTTITGDYLIVKKQAWGKTLNDWYINFGLLVSYSPQTPNLSSTLAGVIFAHSKNLSHPCYTVIEL